MTIPCLSLSLQQLLAVFVQECERQRVAADKNAWQRAGFRYKFAVHALLSGDRKAVDTLLRVRLCVFVGAQPVLNQLHVPHSLV